MAEALRQAAETRMDAILATSEEKRCALAQHLTPPETAELAVSMFSELEADQLSIRCLDLGAGSGILSVALYERYDGHIERIDAVEMDVALATIYNAELASIGVPHTMTLGDALTDTPDAEYARVILNPPYRKMAANDPRQNALPCKSANLYSAFIAVGLTRLAPGGELVAIVPRSWTNGDYFKPFRRFALGDYSLDAMHVYGSRSEVFKDTDVLQETMLVRFSRRLQRDEIIVTQSGTKSDDTEKHIYKTRQLINKETLAVRIEPESQMLDGKTVSSMGFCPSTGKVVDFRCHEHIFEDKPDSDGIYRMAYAGNFTSGVFEHPRSIGKPQWYRADDVVSARQLTQPGCYVVVKRFSAKEERRRVVAYPLIVEDPIAIENHLNFIHAGTPRKVVALRSEELARGLAIWLNSTLVDKWFRGVSGSTQVNARDIKAMPCPAMDALEEIGGKWKPRMSQFEIDGICEEVL